MSSGILPESRIDRVSFLQARLPGWLTNAVALGSTAPTITSLTTLTTSARAAYDAQQLAIGLAKAATQTFHDSVAAMDKGASDVLKQIKLKAATGGGNAVYVLAVLPVPATPSPRPAPGTPNAFTVSLEQTGVLTLAWKCANPAGASGTIYQVARKLGGPGDGAGAGTAEEWSVVGTTGDKHFVDATLPAGGGTDGLVTYQVTAIRSTIAGPPGVFTVKFGAGAPAEGATIMAAPRLAA